MMDQDAFRLLLQTPRLPATPTPNVPTASTKLKQKQIDSSEPAFKPRKVKKEAPRYRDRAAERRGGEAGDYAQVEAVLEDFERRNAGNQDKSTLETQRRYLGGDSDHSILVKGLDYALLEQNKSRAAAASNAEDDDSLEQAFLEGSGSSHPTSSANNVLKKRTREDLIRELKEKRLTNENLLEGTNTLQRSAKQEVHALEEAKSSGKFKPIGCKSAGVSQDAGKKKKVKGDVKDGERKKKRRKVEPIPAESHVGQESQVSGDAQPLQTQPHSDPPPPPPPPLSAARAAAPDSESLPDEDLDIFAGAADYEGVNLSGDDEEEEEEEITSRLSKSHIPDHKPPSAPRRWIETEGIESVTEPAKPNLLVSVLKGKATATSTPQIKESQGSNGDHENEDGGSETQMRLQPLESSALPSIKDFLAMESAANGSGKWKKKKKKGDDADSSKKSADAKVDRDYKRLKNFTDKKTSGR